MYINNKIRSRNALDLNPTNCIRPDLHKKVYCRVFIILFRQNGKQHGHTTHSSFLTTCLCSLGHHQVFDLFTLTYVTIPVLVTGYTLAYGFQWYVMLLFMETCGHLGD